ncbi:hypothetical protein AN8749.2 [Aspergillus nidulans FGSC A4]|uniref:Uncharacterized protein n=1 Tax=Emericella nidulans (strain FGSC A4 / ATCC 38163 / CBS 112.46 / NRRL 194 / M139) TaxID=227321 RepID=Q5ASI1_EMENI|nr:hypothetical protein [Aspergillus nidulans FGSC A4]EAA60542.1 hypothetical protein AN8749.2 [Aspergillus nidulans FGSC A4]CBF78103.1 TPA: conserved hypothetical protein [Aspergillus nidulans FGSC A4]|eukprot:XP_682018.1 hypothetical protein AN8749.2 [Aspergillus nidulans FGSC A4]
MGSTTVAFERLRSVGKHPLRFYMNVAITANYTIPETFTLSLKEYIYKAIETLINQHPILSAIPIGEDTDKPYFARLPEIDLAQPISFQKRVKGLTLDKHDSELQTLLQTQHDTGFAAPLPYWRLIVLTDGESERRFTAVFVYHHGLGDVLLDSSLWSGGPFQLPLSTQVRFLVLSAAQTLALVKVCREHSTTVTCTVETAIARSIFPHIPGKYTRVVGSIPITQRPWLPDTITDESMGVYVQEMPETFARETVTQDTFPWDEAQRARRTITKELALESKNTTVGLFKYVKDYRKDLCESKIGKPRPVTFELSSLGVIKTEDCEDTSIPQMGGVIFTQSASVIGAAMEFSLVTGADGCLALGISWQPGVVEEDTVQVVLDTLEKELHHLSG